MNHTINRITADIDEATAGRDEALAAGDQARADGFSALLDYLRPQHARAVELHAAEAQAAPIAEHLAQKVASTRAKVEDAQRLRNVVGTHDRKLALQRRDDRDVLQQELIALLSEERDARASRDTPAMELERLGIDRRRNEAFRMTTALLERVLAEGHTRELALQIQNQGERLDPTEILWLGAAERRAFAELAARRASSSFGRRWHQVTDEHLATVFSDRRQAIESRRRRLLAAATKASTEAQALTAGAAALEAP